MADGIIDSGAAKLNTLVVQLARFATFTIKVGFQDSSVDEEGTPIVQIAIWNEFGTDDIPARPFLTRAIDLNQKKIGDRYEIEIDKVIAGKQDALRAAKRLGIYGVQLVKESIRKSPSWAEENADATKDKKGSSKPLVDTGEMLNSVTWIIEEKGSVIASG